MSLLGFGGCAGLVHAMINSNSCEQFNIDNIETRIPVGIPSVHSDPECFSCILDKVANTGRIFYYSLGIDKRVRTDWLAVLDKNSGDLWVYMKYKD